MKILCARFAAALLRQGNFGNALHSRHEAEIGSRPILSALSTSIVSLRHNAREVGLASVDYIVVPRVLTGPRGFLAFPDALFVFLPPEFDGKLGGSINRLFDLKAANRGQDEAHAPEPPPGSLRRRPLGRLSRRDNAGTFDQYPSYSRGGA